MVGFTRVRPGGRRAHSGSHVGALGVLGFIMGRWVYWCWPLGWCSSFGVVEFAHVRPGGRWIDSG